MKSGHRILFSRGVWQLLVPVLALALIPACRGRDHNESQQSFKAGLLALDRGDEDTAITEFQRSLAASPKNADARVHLASIYAKRAGFPVEAWLGPMLEIGKDVDVRLRAFARSQDGLHFVEKMGEAGLSEEELVNVDGEAIKVIVRIHKLTLEIWKGMAALLFANDLFDKFPYLNADQLVDLDKAIRILKEDHADPDLRQEKVKVYLAALSFMRLIYNTRAFMSASQLEAGKLFTEDSRFCKVNASDARNELMEIHESLVTLEEGLRVPADADKNPQTEGRRKLHAFVKVRLLGKLWKDFNSYFEEGSEENQAAMRVIGKICGFRSQLGRGEKKPEENHETGADLFNPDEE